MKAAITNTLTTSSTFTDATYATTSQSAIVSSPFEGSWLSGATGTLTIYQDLTVTPGPATYGGGGGDIANNNAGACADVQTQIDTLVAITNTVLSDGDDSNLPAESVATMTGGEAKCKRDIGYFIDAVSLDAFKGGNTYARKFILQYFDVSGRPISNGLLGEEAESVTAFNKARDMMKRALTNQLYVKDLTVTPGPAEYGGAGGDIANTDSGACADVQTTVDTLTAVVTTVITAGDLTDLPEETVGSRSGGESTCARDIGLVVDAVGSDLFQGGNLNIRAAARSYFNSAGDDFIAAGVEGEETESITAYNKARDMMKLAINNQLYYKNFDLIADAATGSNNDPASCQNVKDTIDTLISILTDALTTARDTSAAAAVTGLPAINPGRAFIKDEEIFLKNGSGTYMYKSKVATADNVNYIVDLRNLFD